MTLREFQGLNFEDQIILLEKHRGPVSLRQDDDHTIVLRMIDDFFVESYFKIENNGMPSKIKAFDSINDLLPWVFKLAPKPVHRSAPK
jgi:hypothetical protein